MKLPAVRAHGLSSASLRRGTGNSCTWKPPAPPPRPDRLTLELTGWKGDTWRNSTAPETPWWANAARATFVSMPLSRAHAMKLCGGKGWIWD